ncbi:MAG: pseudoazurin [Pseudochelatococcus sp.]|jgi:pseudoazurin|uniref:pseudoazurin n=1 Tax=Pseudochelatococcus sp. TaxID=2020869 RepID=UPI003D8EE78F
MSRIASLLRALAIGAAVVTGADAAVAGEVHEVRMLNRNDIGPMPYEPDYLAIAPGDTIRFVPTTKGHNAETIKGFVPEGAQPFRSKLSETFEITLTEPGFYGIKCTPHYAMGMVMLVQVRDEAGARRASDVTLPQGLPPRARKRFEEIIDRAAGK